jgi:hypothetical protein
MSLLPRTHQARLIATIVLVATACVVVPLQARSTPPPLVRTTVKESPTISIQSPTVGEVVQGVAIIRFKTENISLESPFLPADQRRSTLPAGHLHVTVDGTAWHWVHSSTDPVVITPLPAGEHTVELELAAANHRPLASQTVRFTVVARKPVATDHAPHR